MDRARILVAIVSRDRAEDSLSGLQRLTWVLLQICAEKAERGREKRRASKGSKSVLQAAQEGAWGAVVTPNFSVDELVDLSLIHI